jgi:hypothetical protein
LEEVEAEHFKARKTVQPLEGLEAEDQPLRVETVLKEL